MCFSSSIVFNLLPASRLMLFISSSRKDAISPNVLFTSRFYGVFAPSVLPLTLQMARDASSRNIDPCKMNPFRSLNLNDTPIPARLTA